VVVRRAQPGQVALVAGDQHTAACLDRDRDDVGIHDHLRARSCSGEHTADDPGEVAIGVPGVEGCSLAGEAGVDELIVPMSAIELG